MRARGLLAHRWLPPLCMCVFFTAFFSPPGEDIAFSFAVQNPAIAQQKRMHHVTIASDGLVVEEDMDGFVLTAGAEPGFSTVRIPRGPKMGVRDGRRRKNASRIETLDGHL